MTLLSSYCTCFAKGSGCTGCAACACLVIPLVVVQIPKLIALASVAMRVQWREADEHLEECSVDSMAVGGVLHLDILSLPAPASKTSSWTLRAVTPETQVIHRHVTHSRTLLAVLPHTQVIHRHTMPTRSCGLLVLEHSACMSTHAIQATCPWDWHTPICMMTACNAACHVIHGH